MPRQEISRATYAPNLSQKKSSSDFTQTEIRPPKRLRTFYKSVLLVIITFLLQTASFFVHAQSLPNPVITGNNAICQGSTTTLTTAAQAGYTYCWRNISSPASANWQTVGNPSTYVGSGFYQSLAFNNSIPYVAFQDEANGYKTSVLKYDGANWVNVGNPGFSANGCDYQNIAFSGNTPYVAFRDWSNSKSTVMKFDGTNWVNVGTPQFSPGEAGFLKLVIIAGTPYVAFQDGSHNYGATVMKFTGTNWVYVGNPGFSLGSVNYMSLSFSGNTPYVAYADASNSAQKTTVMKFDGSNWVNVGNPQFTPGATRNQSLAIDGTVPYVAFVEDALNFKTSVMKFDGSNWVFVGSRGLSAGSSSHLSLAVNNNTPYVAYQDDFNSYKSTLMKYNGTGWVSVGNAGFSPGFDNYQSLAFTGTTPYVAFASGNDGYKTTVMKYQIACEGSNNSFQVSAPGTYTVTVSTTSTNSTTSNPFTVSASPTPAVTCPANMEVCINTPAFSLSGGAPSGGTYSGAGVTGNQFNPAAAGAGIKNITYTYADPTGGCSNNCVFTITVKPVPTVNCNVGTMFVCLNQAPFVLTNVSPAGGTFSGTGVSHGMFNASVAGVGSHTVTYTSADPTTNCSNSCSFTVTVRSLPAVNCNVGTMYVCLNQAPFILANVTPAGGTFTGPGVSNGLFNAAIAGTGTHSITYTVTDQTTGCSNSCSFNIQVNPLPTINCSATNINVCSNAGSFALTNGSPSGGGYSGPGVTNGVFNPATAGAGIHTINYTITNPTNGCSNTCSFVVTVGAQSAPVITPVSNNIIIPLGSTGSVSVTPSMVATISGSCNATTNSRISPSVFNCSSLGVQNVLVEATDGTFSNPTPEAVSFSSPVAIASDNNGTFYVADRGTETIRKITTAGDVTIFAGTTSSSGGFADGQGQNARFLTLSDLATDLAGNIYVADAGNRRIRKITPGGMVTTIAGNGGFTSVDGSGTAASFESPNAITADANGNIFVADAGRIRKITPGGVVTTVAGTTSGFADGNGLNAKFWGPSGLTTDAAGNLYIADGANYRIRKMTPSGDVTTIAGGAGQFGFLHAIVRDAAGDFYVCDSDNYMIKKVTAAGIITNIAGSGTAGNANGTGLAASFNGITGMAISGGNLYVSEFYNHKIRKVTTSGVVTTFAGSGSAFSINGNIGGITGNYSSLIIPVTIADGTAPVITPVSNNIILNLDPSGNRTVTIADVASVSDNCNTPAVRITPSTFNCSSQGLQNVLVEATDGTFGTPNPAAVKFNSPIATVIDAAGNIFVADRGNFKIRKITPAGVVSTFADGFLAPQGSEARFSVLSDMTIDNSGNLWLTDAVGARVKKITPAGVISTFVNGFSSPPGAIANFTNLAAITINSQGVIYIADNDVIKKITPAGVVSILAGSTVGFADGTGAAAKFWGISGLASDAAGNIYVADGANYRIRKVTPNGVVTTVSGSGSNGYADGPTSTALFGFLHAVVVDNNNNIYVTDSDNDRIRKITPAGIVSTYAGGNNNFALMTGLAMKTNGDLIIPEITTHNIVKVDIAGNISTIAGSGIQGYQDGNVSGMTGNYSSLIIPVTIKDATAPIITPISNNIILNLDASGNRTVTLSDVASVLDNCNSNPTVRINPSTFNCSTQGLQNVLIEATDGSFGTGPNPGSVSFINPQTAVADHLGNIYVAANNQIRKITAGGVVTTLAGSGVAGNNDGAGLSASFDGLRGLAIDAAGNIYTAEVSSRKVRKVTPQGVVTTYAGSGAAGSTDGPAASASFIWLYGIVVDPQGNVFVADAGSNKIRKISTSGVVSTYAGTGVVGSTDGPANSATFNYVTSLALDHAGNLYVGEQFKIRKITPSGIVSTFAGSTVYGNVPGIGTNARMARPMGMVFGANGNLFATQEGEGRIIKITPNAEVTTFAGSYGETTINGTGTAATFRSPEGMGIDAAGNLYVADWFLKNIRKITPDAVVTTFAGSGQSGSQNGDISGGGTGNHSSVTVQVQIKDATAPVITPVSNNIILPLGVNGTRTIILSDIATITDNCTSAPLYTINPTTFNCSNTGSQTITVTATDGTFSSTATPENATFGTPYGLKFDAAGNLYIAEEHNHLIRKITPGGTVTTFAGTGTPGLLDGQGTSAKFWAPRGLAIDAAGNIYVSDQVNNAIRKITPQGLVSTLAGGQFGYADGSGTAAQFRYPQGLAIDATGNLFVADGNNHRIRKITPAGLVTTFAGNGTAASFDGTGTAAAINRPKDIDIDNAGNIYVTDDSYKIRKITSSGIVTTVAGTGVNGYVDGPVNSAQFGITWGIKVDHAGNIFIAETAGNRIRKISTSGVVSTFSSTMAIPTGITLSPSGSLYVSSYNTIKELSLNLTVRTIAGIEGQYGSQNGNVGGGTTGNQSMLQIPVTIISNPAFIVTCPENSSICINAPAYTLTGGSPIGGTYTGPGVTGNQFNPATAGTGVHTITYAYTDPVSGCNKSCMFTITVKPLPVVNCNAANIFVCQNQTPFILSNVTPAGGTFSGPGVSGGMFNAVNAGLGSHNITYTYSDPGTGCSNSCTFLITVHPLPAVVCPPNLNVCLNASPITLTGGTPTGGTYTGTGVSGSIFNPSAAGVGSHIISYSFTNQTTGCAGSCTFTITVNGQTAPLISCPANITVPTTSTHPNQTGWATATNGCIAGNITISYTDNTGSQNCYTTRTWKATDAAGNFSTCTQLIAIPQLTVTLGPDMYILYGALGYNGCRTITPTISGGVAPFTYHWTSTDAAVNNAATNSVTACNTSEIFRTYTLTVTSANGCSGSASVTLTFLNISCSNNTNSEKVKICHIQPNDRSKCNTICISSNAVQAMINNGSYYGQCLPDCAIPIQSKGIAGNTSIIVDKTKAVSKQGESPAGLFEVKVMNNPTSSEFLLQIKSNSQDAIKIRVTDVTGRTLELKENIPAEQIIKLGQLYITGVYLAELSQGLNRKVVKLIKQ